MGSFISTQAPIWQSAACAQVSRGFAGIKCCVADDPAPGCRSGSTFMTMVVPATLFIADQAAALDPGLESSSRRDIVGARRKHHAR
jgi:hypothetical protein